MAEIKHEIIEHIAILSTKGSWRLELNLVSWNGGTPKYDIRSWNQEHTNCSKGVTLTTHEMKIILNRLHEMGI